MPPMTVDWLDVAKTIGAIVGVLALAFNVFKFRQEHRTAIQVTMSNGFLTAGPEISDAHLLLSAANVGNKVVVLSAAEISIPGGKKLVSPRMGGTAPLPRHLAPGESQTMWIEMKSVARTLMQEGRRGNVD